MYPLTNLYTHSILVGDRNLPQWWNYTSDSLGKNVVFHPFWVRRRQVSLIPFEWGQPRFPSTLDWVLSSGILAALAPRGRALNVLFNCMVMSTDCGEWRCVWFQDAICHTMEWIQHLKEGFLVFVIFFVDHDIRSTSHYSLYHLHLYLQYERYSSWSRQYQRCLNLVNYPQTNLDRWPNGLLWSIW